jgi:hypothetical protein
MGFATFPGSFPRSRHRSVETGRALLPFPAARVHTPRRIPLTCSRTASLRPLPSCRYYTRTSSLLTPAETVAMFVIPPKRDHDNESKPGHQQAGTTMVDPKILHLEQLDPRAVCR